MNVSGEGWPAVVDRRSLEAHLVATVDPDRLAALQAHRDRLAESVFDVFGELTKLDGWHDDPSVEGSYEPESHWTDVATPVEADVKRVWEPSRFTWGFDLARLHLVDSGAGSADLFWQKLDDWMEHNPPNAGINWSCGQEASMRLLSVIAAADAMSDSLTDDRRRAVRQLAVVTADRVAANIGYARSQANNHHASEAMGLITCGLLFSGEPGAANWLRAGERHLAEVCEKLVFADGGTSQYSTNYHRVFLHDFVWTAQVYRAVGREVPKWLRATGASATSFLAALTEPTTGRGPFFGPDDGARVLPLTSSTHRHLSGDVQLAASCFDVAIDPAVSSDVEPLAWFGLGAPASTGVASGDEAWVQSFPDIGVHILGSGPIRVYVRATHWNFRPAHDDQLHCDIWIEGVNVVGDPGTATYHPQSGQPGPLSAASNHNGPRLVDGRGMAKASKFLWAKWTHAQVVSLSVVDGRATGTFVHDVAGVAVNRIVEVGDDVTITDRSEAPFESSWLIDDGSIDAISTSAEWEEVVGVTAPRYGTSEPAVYRIVQSAERESDQWLQTVVSPAVAR